MHKNRKMLAFLAFSMYLLTGATCIVVGSSLPHLAKLYGLGLDKVVLLGSAYALGRVLTVYMTGRMVEKFGPMKVLAAGVVLLTVFLIGVPLWPNYYAGMAFSFLGGIGMGAQDTVCPLLLSMAFKENYAGSMSAGQAFFGLGNFTTPFLIGIMLSGSLPFYYSYYILLILPVVILLCLPFAGTHVKESAETHSQESEEVKPLYTRNKRRSYGALIVGNIAYCAATGGIIVYTSSFAESLGFSAANSAFMLTAFNVGCFVGSVAFVQILRKVKEQTVLLVNSLVSLAAIAVMLLVDQAIVYFICLFIAGFFIGVLFSVYVTLAVRIDYTHISRASSHIALAGGGSDILTPIMTGAMVSIWGVGIAFHYVIVMFVICIAAAFVLWMSTKGKEEEHYDTK